MSKPFRTVTDGGKLVKRRELESAMNQHSNRVLKALSAMFDEFDGRLKAVEKPTLVALREGDTHHVHYDITPEGRAALDAVPTDAEGPEAA